MNRLSKGLSFVLLAILFGCNLNDKYTISGVIENGSDQTIYLQQFDVANSTIIDSIKLGPKGKFKFKGDISAPGFYTIKKGVNTINLVVYPGDKIHIQTDAGLTYGNTLIEGSEESQNILKLNEGLQKTRQKLNKINEEFNEATRKNAPTEELNKLILKYDSVLNNQRREHVGYIIQNTNKLSSLMALYQKINDNAYLLNRVRDVQFYKILNDSLSKYFPDSKYVAALKNNTDEFITRYNTQILLNNVENVTEAAIPTLRIPDLKGDTVSTAEIKDKLLIVSFWASWDQASTTFSRQLSAIYKKYKKRGLEVYSISLDTDKEQWETAINFEELNDWINVSELSYPNSYAASIMNVQTLPTYYLVSEDRKEMLGKNLSIQQLDRRLNNLLKEQ